LSDAALSLIGVAICGVFILIGVSWIRWTERSISPRAFTTTLDPATLRTVFDQAVGSWGWRVVAGPEPTVARSTRMGEKQEITLVVQPAGVLQHYVQITPTKVAYSFRSPVKPHTIRLRVDRYLAAVQRLDPNIQPHRLPRISPMRPS
jgi:hypothetical protein